MPSTSSSSAPGSSANGSNGDGPNIDHALLRDYAGRLHHYGDLDSPVWFLDVEEGGRITREEIARRLREWQRRGRPVGGYLCGPTASPPPDCRRYLGEDDARALLHPVWSQQLRVLGGLCGQSPGNEQLRVLQGRAHGAPAGPTCLMSLYPLPCRGAGDWIYDRVPFDDSTPFNPFETKARYRTLYLAGRLDGLCRRVRAHRPAVLVCMAWAERDALRSVLEHAVPLPLPGVSGDAAAIVGRLGDTLVIVCAHPSGSLRGAKNRYFQQVGRAARGRLSTGTAAALSTVFASAASQSQAGPGQRFGAGTGGDAEPVDPRVAVLARERQVDVTAVHAVGDRACAQC